MECRIAVKVSSNFTLKNVYSEQLAPNLNTMTGADATTDDNVSVFVDGSEQPVPQGGAPRSDSQSEAVFEVAIIDQRIG